MSKASSVSIILVWSDRQSSLAQLEGMVPFIGQRAGASEEGGCIGNTGLGISMGGVCRDDSFYLTETHGERVCHMGGVLAELVRCAKLHTPR